MDPSVGLEINEETAKTVVNEEENSVCVIDRPTACVAGREHTNEEDPWIGSTRKEREDIRGSDRHESD